MDFLEGVTAITISHTDLNSILAKTTNNPIAENQVPSMLKDAIAKIIVVKITDQDGKENCRLVLENGGFKFSPLQT